MSAIQEIFRRYAGQYLERYGHTMPAAHRKTIHAIDNCRNGHFGTHLYGCSSCRLEHAVPCSCGNRHCPTCQGEKASLWLSKRVLKLKSLWKLLAAIRTTDNEGLVSKFSSFTLASLRDWAGLFI